MSAAAPAPEDLAVRVAYSPHKPTAPQHAFLLLDDLLGVEEPSEALYGGAAGGGKSDALLMGALRYVDVPGYGALLLRRTLMDLGLQDALIPRSLEWLSGTDAEYNANDYRWTFPSGAVLQFGYLATERHKYRYQGSAYQFIGIDEATQIPMNDVRYLWSRLRRPMDPENPLSRVPLRLRLASNPGGVSHEGIKLRYVEQRVDPDDEKDTPRKAARRIFIPAKLNDNPHLDREAYLLSLENLDRVTRAQLLDGDWDVDTGDRIYPPRGIDAALSHGAELDELARDGQQPPPVGDLIAIGLDWGSRKWIVVGYPLEGGGMWIVAAQHYTGVEVTSATDAMLDLLTDTPKWAGMPARPIDRLADARYDSAGLESMRTFLKVARRLRPRLRAIKVTFNTYKRETINYTRHLLERAEEGHRVGVLAISGGPLVDRLFISQLRALRKDPKDPELPLKPDTEAVDEERDDGPDALVALMAPVARVHRGRYAANAPIAVKREDALKRSRAQIAAKQRKAT